MCGKLRMHISVFCIATTSSRDYTVCVTFAVK